MWCIFSINHKYYTIIILIQYLFYVDDESKSMGSNEDSNSLHRFDESRDQLLILEKQYQGNINGLKTKITDLTR